MITYSNRKGVTYRLRRGAGPTGKVRYFFVREPESEKGEPVEVVPEGYEISESVNGVVSLARQLPSSLLPEEIETVATAIRRHLKSRNYRVVARGRQIIVHEYAGPDAEGLAQKLARYGLGDRITADSLSADFGSHASYTPVLRFTLEASQSAAGPRTFRVDRWCYQGSIDGWLDLFSPGTIADLVNRIVPTLGSDAFFELD